MQNLKNLMIKFQEPKFLLEEVHPYTGTELNLESPISWDSLKQSLIQDVESIEVKNFGYLLWVLAPKFIWDNGGLFLSDYDEDEDFQEDIKKYGKFKAEGSANHVHLKELTNNLLIQFMIGLRAIYSWSNALSSFKNLEKACIYLNKTNGYTLCIYSNPTDSDLSELDNKIMLHHDPIKTLTFREFLEWAN